MNLYPQYEYEFDNLESFIFQPSVGKWDKITIEYCHTPGKLRPKPSWVGWNIGFDPEDILPSINHVPFEFSCFTVLILTKLEI